MGELGCLSSNDIFGAWIYALAFVGTNYRFSKTGPGDAEVERKKRLDLTEVILQKAKKINATKIK